MNVIMPCVLRRLQAICLACLLPGCATTAGLFDFGVEKPGERAVARRETACDLSLIHI